MDSKHIKRDYSAHRKSIIRPYDEYVKLEIYSFDPKYTQTYLREKDTLKKGTNCEATSWKRWSCFKSANQQDLMNFTLKYDAIVTGNYRIDLLYEQNDYIHKDENGKTNKKNSNKDLLGSVVFSDEEKQIKFDGENNVLKRKTLFKKWDKGLQSFKVNVPHNCYFLGVIVRKIVKFVGDNYYGDALGSEQGNMVLTNASFSKSDMTKPSELSCTVFYDDAFECDEHPSGFYIDYHDEVNFYVRTDDGSVKQIFGGYVSSILPDADRTKLTIACADRLIDGQNKYILDQMRLGGGTTDENNYPNAMTKDFDSYPKALKYLCDIHETTLKSNISNNFTVDGEKYHKGFVVTYGKTKKVKSLEVSNGITKSYKNYVLVRNKPTPKYKQVFTLYNAKKYAKKPVEITEYPYLHITYGLGEVKTEYKSKTTEKVDKAETTAGSQEFNSCGVSKDGKYLMAIGLPSASRDSKKGFTKTIFHRKCPHCGSDKLYWGYMWKGNFPCTKRFNNGSDGRYEGHIYCDGCDADYSCQGWEHINGSSKRVKLASSVMASSKSEAYKLANGKMSAVPTTGEEISADDVFKAITKIAFKYKYRLGAGSSSYASMKKCGYGDCWAFSELIFDEMKKYKISVKISQYNSGYASNHRSVLYKDANGKWQDFPYREQGWGKRYNNMLNNYPIGRSKHGHIIKEYKGGTIANVKSSTSTKKTQTTQVTHTKGYDKSKPFQAFIRLTYSLDQSFKSKTRNLDIKFTLNPTSSNSLNSGFALYWINDSIKQATLKLENGKTLIDYLKTIHGESSRFFIHTIQFIAPQKKATKQDEDIDWYKSDDSNDDNSSCKMKLYQIVFDDNPSLDPSKIESCGKNINSVMQTLVDDAGYYVDMTYGSHRMDDQIHFRVNTQSSEQYVATEGDDNNILSWNSISYTPINTMYNTSVQVFKNTSGQYKYIESSNSESVLQYGEQCTLQTKNDTMSYNEAYFNAKNSDKFNYEHKYTYTITVPNCPNIVLGDLVKVVANARKLNSVKEVKSLKISFDYDKMPRIKTEIGLDELAPNLQLQKNLRKLKEDTKKKSTVFSASATPVTEDIYYEWEQ